MNRQPSRGMVRRAASVAFIARNRCAVLTWDVREPQLGETPLSRAEVLHGVRMGLITPLLRPLTTA